mgnify:CR=1 FL=1
MNDRVRRVHCSNGFYEFDSHTTTKIYKIMSKKEEELITMSYLKSNKIPYHVHNDTIISFPQTSPQFENLYCKYTECVHHDDSKTPIILIHNFTN